MLNLISATSQENVAHAKVWGGFNDVPPGWRMISQVDFIQRTQFFTYTPTMAEYRQMVVNPHNEYRTMTPAHLFFFHDGTGVGIVVNHYAGTLTFYAFGCEHTYVELTPDVCRVRGIRHEGQCWHVQECTTCHRINTYDSGD